MAKTSPKRSKSRRPTRKAAVTKRTLKERVSAFAEAKREQTLINIENNTSLGILAKWFFTNWVSILIIFSLSVACFKYYRDSQIFKEQALQEEINVLKSIVDSNAATNAELKGRIKELSDLKKHNKESNSRVRSEAKKLDSPGLKAKIEEYVSRGKSVRGVK